MCILTSGAPRRRLARFLAFSFLEVPGSDWCFLKHSIEKAVHSGIWSSGSDWCVSLSILLRTPCLLISGAPRLRLVRYLNHSIKNPHKASLGMHIRSIEVDYYNAQFSYLFTSTFKFICTITILLKFIKLFVLILSNPVKKQNIFENVGPWGRS